MWASAGFAIAGVVVAGILLRPWRTSEWQWAAGGAAAAVLLGIESPAAAARAVSSGATVYAFLTGVAVLAEVGRRGGAFAWLAALARRGSRGSRFRLFGLIYAAGTAVTVLLSNDTTALALTPAIFTTLEATGADPLPYLYGCAFVANAASFALPFSNPANLIAFDGRLPALGPWLSAFGSASAAGVLVTFLLLAWAFAARLRKPLPPSPARGPLEPRTRAALAALAAAGAVLALAAAMRWNLGVAALLAAIVSGALLYLTDRGAPAAIAARFPWQILPLLAGLLVIVDALDRSGGLSMVRTLLERAGSLGPTAGALAAAFGTAVASCAINNLPVALALAFAHGPDAVPDRIVRAAVVGIDLGPNLFVTGSLSSLLWSIALRREGLDVSPVAFFRIGVRVGAPALLVAGLLVR